MICKIKMRDIRAFERAWIAQSIENRKLKKRKLLQTLIYKRLKQICSKLRSKNFANFLKFSQISCSFQVGLRNFLL